ncbi:MAG: O-antigen ligase family protein [Gammaproteobacteria bacterium]|nr:O-antigen ligase family protein [Gammaproteobacteria bacterium]
MTFSVGVQSIHTPLHKAIYFSLIAVFLCSFISKAAINIFTGLAYIAVLVFLWRDGFRLLRTYSWWVLFLLPLTLGLLTSSLTAAGGIEEIGRFLARFKFFLLPLAIILVARNEKTFLGLFVAAWASALVATLYGVGHAEQRSLGAFNGVLFIGRNADMLLIVILTITVFLFDKDFRMRYQKWIWLLLPSLLIFSYGLLMSGIRGAWLGYFVGALTYGLMFCRKLLVVLTIMIAMAFLFANESKLMDEARSISDVSDNHSNSARLQLWQSGWDFSQNQFWLGSGRSDLEQRFVDYLDDQPLEYQQTHALAALYPGDFHNSYLQILVEWGALWFLLMTVCGALLFYNLYQSLMQVSPGHKAYVHAAIAVSAGYLFSQFFHGELYSYGTILYLLVLTAGLAAGRWQGCKEQIA